MNWKPDITVSAVIVREGRFLIVEERIKGRHVFNQPAGHVEIDESPLTAVVRETLEETAWQFTPEHIVGVYVWRKPGSSLDTLRIVYCGQLGAHDPTRAYDHPIVATHWLSRDELCQRSAQLRTPLVLRCIDDFNSGQRLPLYTLSDLRVMPDSSAAA
jgi:8-oxo-dGTP pyrophosphatase MutT (NUDIX family)